MSLSEQELVRRNALNRLRELGIDPYPATEFITTHTAKSILDNYKEKQTVRIAGRLMSRRIMGKASFVELKDHTGKIQLYCTRDDLSIEGNHSENHYNEVFKRLLDIGDIIGVEGFLFKTKVGEITVHVQNVTILCKSLRPLPIVKTDSKGFVYDSFSDPELRYRMRYVDLIVNDHVKNTFIVRSKVIQSMRAFLSAKGYLEVETPILQPIPGGATAHPFVTHHNALNIPLYLRIANELYLKKLIVGGFEGVFEFAKDFRNEGMDRAHNPEFTMIELYVAYKDYQWMMELTETMFLHIAKETLGTSKFKIGDREISFEAPFRKIGILDLIKEKTGHDLYQKTEEEIREIAKQLNVEIDETMGKGKLIDAIFGETCEDGLIQPTFIIDYPEEMSPLTKKCRSKEGLTERFELFISGKEIANAYSELNDPIDQRKRFEDQLKLSEKGDDEAMFIDHDFLRALEYGMPNTAGIGIGIDRLVMLLTNRQSIQEVLFFPQMRPEKGEFASATESEQGSEQMNPEHKPLAISDEAKSVLELLKKAEKIPLNDLKVQSGLSNKKWDKSIKELTKNNLAKVVKVDNALVVELG